MVDINTMFHGNYRLKLGERRLLEQQLQIVKKLRCDCTKKMFNNLFFKFTGLTNVWWL